MPAAVATANGQVLTSTTAGVLSWTTPAGGSVTADNGANMSTLTNVELGGNLTKPTTITNSGNTLTVAGSAASTVHASNGAVGIGGAPNASTILDLTNTIAGSGTGAAFRWPTNPNPSVNIAAPAVGDMVYNSTTGCFNFYNGAWVTMGCPCNTAPTIPTITASCSQSWQGSSITYTSSVTTGVTFTWSVSATAGVPTITAGQGTSSITVTWPSSGAATGTVTLSLTNMCGTTTATLAVPINATPTISGTTPISINTVGNVYTCSLAGATYAWSFTTNTNGSTIVGSTIGQTATVTAGSTAGSFTLQCVVSFGSCTQTITYPVTVNACITSVVYDVSATTAQNVNTISITTTAPNEMIIVETGASMTYASNFTPSVTYAGAGSGTATQIVSNFATYFTSYKQWAVVFAFPAPTQGTYNITVNESGASQYYNQVASFKGFCTTPSVASNVTTLTPGIVNYTSSVSSISTTVTTSVTNSVILSFGSMFSTTCATSGAAFTWTGATDLKDVFDNCWETDGSIAYTNAPTATNYTITCKEVYTTNNPDILDGVLQPVYIHP